MTDGGIDWGELLFSSSGRMGRAPFVIVGAGLLGVAAVFPHWGAWAWAGWLVYPLLLFCGACILCKRLHDRGRAGWWAGLVLLAIGMNWPAPHGVMGWVLVPVLVWAVVELGCFPGTTGHNGYGPEPGGG